MAEGWDYLFIALAAAAAGAINALAGGGTLLSFPALIATGVSPISANITNTIALLPGYIGGTLAQWKDIRAQTKRLWLILPAIIVGGLLGGVLLVLSGEKVFDAIIPYLILLASLLLAAQDPLRQWLAQRAAQKGRDKVSEYWSVIPIGLASVYGGYFGAGLSVIVLAALGLTSDESLTKLNALKQAVAFSVNLAAAIFFVFSGHALWNIALVMAAAALLGGWLGGKLAGSIQPNHLRWLVVGIGLVVGIMYLLR